MRDPSLTDSRHIVVAITGASGSRFGLRTVQALLEVEQKVSLLISPSGLKVMQYETGLGWNGDAAEMTQILRDHYQSERINYYGHEDFFAPVASGSSAPDAVVVVPCSMGTVARIAAGLSNNLIERVADVALKERSQMILVPRETPFSTIHLENLLRLSQAGAQILPAMPAYYQKPKTLDDLDDFLVGKILDSLNLPHQLFQRWGDGIVDDEQ